MFGQLGHGNIRTGENIPKKLVRLKDIQHLSYGCCGSHFLAKDSRKIMFEMGDTPLILPATMNPEYYIIWGEPKTVIRAKSARK